MEQISAQVQEIFRKVFDAPSLELRNEMTANDVDKWDSLSHLSMISSVEDHFGIKFKLKELVKMKNVGDMLVLIHEKLNNPA